METQARKRLAGHEAKPVIKADIKTLMLTSTAKSSFFNWQNATTDAPTGQKEIKPVAEKKLPASHAAKYRAQTVLQRWMMVLF